MGGDAAKQRKAAQLENEVAQLEAALEAAQAEYQRVKGRNLQVGRGHAGTRPKNQLGIARLKRLKHPLVLVPLPLPSRSWSAPRGSGPPSLGG